MFARSFVGDVSSLNIGRRKFRLLHSNPNVYSVENFVNENEMETIEKEAAVNLQSWGVYIKRRRKKIHGKALEGAGDVGRRASDAVIPRDYQAELKYLRFGKACSAFVRQLEERAGSLVGESSTNVEPIGLVSDGDIDFFSLHHSHGDLQNDGREVDPRYLRRITTMYLYCTTRERTDWENCKLVFPKLGLHITPRKGEAILFCNVLGDGTPDPRVQHYSVKPTPPPPVGAKNSFSTKGLQFYGLAVWVTDTNLQELTMLGEEGGKRKKASSSPKRKKKKKIGKGKGKQI
jgi:hypothetical protein